MSGRGGRTSASQSTGQHRAAAASYRSSAARGASRNAATWGARGAAAAYGHSGTKDAAAAGAYKAARAHGATKHQAKAAARGAAAAVSGLNTQGNLNTAPSASSSSSRYRTARAPQRPINATPANTSVVFRLQMFENSPYYVGTDWREHLEAPQHQPAETEPPLTKHATTSVQSHTPQLDAPQHNSSSRSIPMLVGIILVLLLIALALSS